MTSHSCDNPAEKVKSEKKSEAKTVDTLPSNCCDNPAKRVKNKRKSEANTVDILLSNYCENPAKRVKTEKNSEAKTVDTLIDEHGYVVCNTGQMLGSYKIEDMIGEGSFGRVVNATNVISGATTALKVMKNNYKVAMSEVNALKIIGYCDPSDESFCIKMLDYFYNDTYFCIAFPVMGMSVYEVLKENNFDPFPIDQVLHISYQLCSAVGFLHRNRMTHTDLKPENILFINSTFTTVYDSRIGRDINRINCTDIRLIDFGLLIRDGDVHPTTVSTGYYRAPEVLLKLGWSQPCDVWSIGCVLVEIYFGTVLFDTQDDLTHLAMMEKTLGPIPTSMANSTKTTFFTNGKLDAKSVGALHLYIPLQEYKLDNDDDDINLFDLIGQMLEYESTKRIVLRKALKHKIFAKLVTQKLVKNIDELTM